MGSETSKLTPAYCWCGKTFERATAGQKYCTTQCAKGYDDYKMLNKERQEEAIKATKNCKFCGKSFIPSYRQKKFCTKECALAQPKTVRNEKRKSVAKTYEKVCEICGQPFLGHRPHAMYCKEECKMEASRLAKLKSREKYENESRLGEKVECKICGELFTRRVNYIKFCSTQCKSDSAMLKNRKALDDREVTEFMMQCVARDIARGYELDDAISRNARDFNFNRTFFENRAKIVTAEMGEYWQKLIEKCCKECNRKKVSA